MEAARRGKMPDPKQGTLDLLVMEQALLKFTRTNVLHVVTQFIAVDNQVSTYNFIQFYAPDKFPQSLAVVNKTTFRNCLVSMRPSTMTHDLPTTHGVVNHLHNEFVRWLRQLNADIEVSYSCQIGQGGLTIITLQKAPGKVSTTADSWTVNTTKAGFLGVTAHSIDIEVDKWTLRSEVIGFRTLSGEHSGQNLGRCFVGVCDRVGLIDSERSKVS